MCICHRRPACRRPWYFCVHFHYHFQRFRFVALCLQLDDPRLLLHDQGAPTGHWGERSRLSHVHHPPTQGSHRATQRRTRIFLPKSAFLSSPKALRLFAHRSCVMLLLTSVSFVSCFKLHNKNNNHRLTLQPLATVHGGTSCPLHLYQAWCIRYSQLLCMCWNLRKERERKAGGIPFAVGRGLSRVSIPKMRSCIDSQPTRKWYVLFLSVFL